jgi:predicted PurR-regulated permease PerM
LEAPNAKKQAETPNAAAEQKKWKARRQRFNKAVAVYKSNVPDITFFIFFVCVSLVFVAVVVVVVFFFLRRKPKIAEMLQKLTVSRRSSKRSERRGWRLPTPRSRPKHPTRLRPRGCGLVLQSAECLCEGSSRR